MKIYSENLFQKTRSVAKKSTGSILWIFLVGLVLVTSCEKLKDLRTGIEEGGLSEPQQIIPNDLLGTKWSAVGLFDANTDTLIKEFYPPADECYSLIFDTDTTLSGRGYLNRLNGKCNIDYRTNNINILIGSMTYAGAIFDEKLYIDTLNTVYYFSLRDSKLRLHFGRHNYLLFNSLIP